MQAFAKQTCYTKVSVGGGFVWHHSIIDFWQSILAFRTAKWPQEHSVPTYRALRPFKTAMVICSRECSCKRAKAGYSKEKINYVWWQTFCHRRETTILIGLLHIVLIFLQAAPFFVLSWSQKPWEKILKNGEHELVRIRNMFQTLHAELCLVLCEVCCSWHAA